MKTEGKTLHCPISSEPSSILDRLEDQQHQRPPNENKTESSDLQITPLRRGCKGWSFSGGDLEKIPWWPDDFGGVGVDQGHQGWKQPPGSSPTLEQTPGPPNLITKCHICSLSEQCQGGDSTPALGSLFQCSATLEWRNCSWYPPLAQPEAVCSCPVTCSLREESNPHLATTSLQGILEWLNSPQHLRCSILFIIPWSAGIIWQGHAGSSSCLSCQRDRHWAGRTSCKFITLGGLWASSGATENQWGLYLHPKTGAGARPQQTNFNHMSGGVGSPPKCHLPATTPDSFQGDFSTEATAQWIKSSS